jgi:hypothetical protein
MTTIWKSGDKEPTNQKSRNQAMGKKTISGTMLSSWSRQQKLAMIASFTILGLLLALSACSKQSPKPALVGVSSSVSNTAATAVSATSPSAPVAAAATTPKKKVRKQRPANVTYSDPNLGISFLYPRKSALTTGDEALAKFAGMGDAQMNFAQPGGTAVATVELPGGSYPGTDFASAFFNMNVNRNVTEEECEHFALVDSHHVNGGPVDTEKVKIGSTDMTTTSDFSASALTQTEAQYYHSYENGACYEYILGVNTAGYGVKDDVAPVNRDEVFAKLEKIMATVKITPVEAEHVAEQRVSGTAGGKE